MPAFLRVRFGLGLVALAVLAGCASVAGTAVPGATPQTTASGTDTTSESATRTSASRTTETTRTSATTRASETTRATEATRPSPIPDDSVVSSAPGTDAPPQNLAVGEPVGVTVFDGAGTVTLVTVERKTEAADEYADAPTKGNYVVLDVSYEATEGELDYNLFDWSIRDAEGRRYDAGGSYDGYEPSLSSGTLSKGNKARGLVVIDAPVGPLTAEYTPSSIAPATWAIPG